MLLAIDVRNRIQMAVVDRIIDHLKLTFVAEKPPPESALQDLPMVADPPVDYFS